VIPIASATTDSDNAATSIGVAATVISAHHSRAHFASAPCVHVSMSHAAKSNVTASPSTSVVFRITGLPAVRPDEIPPEEDERPDLQQDEDQQGVLGRPRLGHETPTVEPWSHLSDLHD